MARGGACARRRPGHPPRGRAQLAARTPLPEFCVLAAITTRQRTNYHYCGLCIFWKFDGPVWQAVHAQFNRHLHCSACRSTISCGSERECADHVQMCEMCESADRARARTVRELCSERAARTLAQQALLQLASALDATAAQAAVHDGCNDHATGQDVVAVGDAATSDSEGGVPNARLRGGDAALSDALAEAAGVLAVARGGGGGSAPVEIDLADVAAEQAQVAARLEAALKGLESMRSRCARALRYCARQ